MVNVKVFLSGFLSVFLIFIILTTTTTDAASIIQKRSTEVLNICKPGVRCGWYVYNKQTRRLEDSHRACQCQDLEQCVRAEDDVSISAYVYRCAPISTQPEKSDLASS